MYIRVLSAQSIFYLIYLFSIFDCHCIVILIEITPAGDLYIFFYFIIIAIVQARYRAFMYILVSMVTIIVLIMIILIINIYFIMHQT